MKNIKYITGDATLPIGDGNKIIVHICNDIGGWGKGFVVAISNRWKLPEEKYRAWYKDRTTNNFELGATQIIQVTDDIFVGNMIGQVGIKKQNNQSPIRYEAVEKSMQLIVKFAKENNASVHMPRIGCGLAGGKWEEIETILERTLLKNEIETIVYDFK
jgi:O-acetyl-ADP-ribose deacetylase (regulator of RNase III)